MNSLSLRSGERARERGAEGHIKRFFINIFRHSPLPGPLPTSSSWGEGEDVDRRPVASFCSLSCGLLCNRRVFSAGGGLYRTLCRTLNRFREPSWTHAVASSGTIRGPLTLS